MRRDLRLALIVAFIDVSAAQEKFRLAQERERLAAEILQAHASTVDGGQVLLDSDEKGPSVFNGGTCVPIRGLCGIWSRKTKTLLSLGDVAVLILRE